MAFLSHARGLRLENFVDTRIPALNIASKKPVTAHDTEALENIIPKLTEGFRRIPVIGKKTGDFRGIVTATDVLDYLGAGPKYSIFTKHGGSLRIPVRGIMETNVHALDKKHSVKRALEVFHIQRRGAYPILYRGKLMGIISEWDLVRHIDSPTGINVEQLMVRKPLTAGDASTLLEVAKAMVMGQTRRLPVARDSILLGIITPGDILSYMGKNNALSGLRMDRTRVTGAMSREVMTLEPGLDICEAARIMREKGIGGLPVVEDSELLGILTERDIVDALR